MNKRVNVYKEGNFVYDIATPYTVYVRSMVVSQNVIYLMDYDAGKIYALDENGTLIKDIMIPANMESYLMRKLYVQEDGSVWLLYENNVDGNSSRGVDCSYLVDDLPSRKMNGIEGFTKDGTNIYNVLERDLHSASLGTDNLTTRNSENKIQINTTEILADLRILDVDKNNCVLVDVFEMVDTSIIAGEYTVRKYSDNQCESIAVIDLQDYYFIPNNVLEVSESGEVYQIKCFEDEVQIVKKAFIDFENFETNIDNIKEASLALEAELNAGVDRSMLQDAPNDLYTTIQNAMDCCDLSWTYKSENASNPNSATVTVPNYLANASKPSTQTGIPYCWGGFDGVSTSSSSAWSNFSGAMNNKKFAGNVNTSTGGYQSGTAGLDCSGFVSSTAGFSSKLGTSHLASSTYTQALIASSRSIYDIYVNSGSNSHVLYYVGVSTNGITTREATTTGEEKAKTYTRSTAKLIGYSLRRFNGW